MIYGKICSSNWFLMFSCICSLQKLYSHVPYPNFLAKHILLYLLFPNVDIFSKGCLTGPITWQGGVSQLPPTLQVVPKSHLSFKTQLVFSRHPKTCTVLRTQILILATEPSNFRDEKQLYKLSILLPFPCADFTEQGQLLAIQYKWSVFPRAQASQEGKRRRYICLNQDLAILCSASWFPYEIWLERKRG